jgi:hypothetical protein
MYEDGFREGNTSVPLDRPMRAEIHNTVTTDGEDLFVTLSNVDEGERTWGPVLGWSPRVHVDGTRQMPYEGAEALVVLDDEKDLWMINWWPYA